MATPRDFDAELEELARAAREAHEAAVEAETRAGMASDTPAGEAFVREASPASNVVPLKLAGPPRYGLLEAKGIFAPLPPMPWVVEGLAIAPGAPTLIAGYGYSAKTLAAQALLLAVAAGRRIWGEFVCKRGRCIHIDHEQGERLCRERYQRLALAYGIPFDELEGMLALCSMPSLYLTHKAAEDALVAVCMGAAICLIDSFRASVPGVDENDSKVREYLDILTRVSERTGCTFIVIHHAGKSKGDEHGSRDERQSPRGSSGIFDACQTVLKFDGKKGEPTRVSMHKERARGGAVEDFYLAVEDVAITDETGKVWERAGVAVNYQCEEQVNPPQKPGEAFAAKVRLVEDFIRRNPGVAGVERIAEMMGIRPTTIRQAVGDLMDRGVVVDRGATKPRRPRLYIATEGA